jgi:hypothetical protein
MKSDEFGKAKAEILAAEQDVTVMSPKPSCGDQRVFGSFAKQVYADATEIYLEPLPLDAGERFLVPALYGGDAPEGDPDCTFEFLVVLEGPSVSFTRKRWKTLWSVECATADEAVCRHRQIFFEWASLEPQAELFRVLVHESSTVEEFFRRVYITDVWKDAAFQTNRKRNNPAYQAYWQQKLALEFSRVRTKAVVFVGRQARKYGWGLLPAGTRHYFVPFPKWTKKFRVGLQRLTADLRVERQDERSTDQSADSEQGATSQLDLNLFYHSWTLNDAINHNVFNVIPADQRHTEMSLFYQGARGAKKFTVGGSTLDLKELVDNGLAREVDGRFWLRFVHDIRDHGIYIQLNRRSPRRLFANVPPDAVSYAN